MGLLVANTAEAGPAVMKKMVRDAQGRARVVYVRVADNRILYPRVVQQIVRPGRAVEYRPAFGSAYRPGGNGYGVYRADYGYGLGGLPGRRFFPVRSGYGSTYRPLGNYGVDGILTPGNRGKFGIPGYGLPGGAFPRLVVPAPLPGLPLPRYSGNVKGR